MGAHAVSKHVIRAHAAGIMSITEIQKWIGWFFLLFVVVLVAVVDYVCEPK